MGFRKILDRVMMTAVRLPRSNKQAQEELRYWAEVEYKQDGNFVYNRLISGQGLPKRY